MTVLGRAVDLAPEPESKLLKKGPRALKSNLDFQLFAVGVRGQTRLKGFQSTRDLRCSGALIPIGGDFTDQFCALFGLD